MLRTLVHEHGQILTYLLGWFGAESSAVRRDCPCRTDGGHNARLDEGTKPARSGDAWNSAATGDAQDGNKNSSREFISLAISFCSGPVVGLMAAHKALIRICNFVLCRLSTMGRRTKASDPSLKQIYVHYNTLLDEESILATVLVAPSPSA